VIEDQGVYLANFEVYTAEGVPFENKAVPTLKFLVEVAK
jgi:hypothetical protein